MSDNLMRTELSRLERKLILLLNDFKKKNEEIEVLRQENDKLKASLDDKRQKIESFQNKDKISKIASGMVVDGKNTEALSDLLSEYIIEVDKCIAQLSE